MRQLLLLFAAVALAPAVVRAQSAGQDVFDQARFRIGPFGITPSIAVRDLGIDTNVLNESVDPQKDFTVTLAPQLESWLRAGRSRTSLTGRADLVYFQKLASERAVVGGIDGRFEIPGNRLTPWVAAAFQNGRQRVGYEIDARASRVTNEVALGADLRIGAATRVSLSGRRSSLSFDPDARFRGLALRETLNRDSDFLTLQYDQALTPLTTFVVQASSERDRFDLSPHRDSNSLRVQAGFDLGRQALIGGRVRIGLRRFNGLDEALPDYTGLVASISTGITLAGRTRLQLDGDRDVSYSFEPSDPYYVLTGGTLSLTPRLTPKWDVQGRVGGQRLAYRTLSDGAAITGRRLDRFVLFGVGVGYYLGPDTRLGFNLDRQRRRSPRGLSDYEGYRIGTSVTYGR